MLPILSATLTLLMLLVPAHLISRRWKMPLALVQVAVGIAASLIPGLPKIELDSDVVLFLFLPPLVYAASFTSTWDEIRRNVRAITMMSVGHVVFITLLIAVSVKWLVPGIGWPLAVVLGAVISPPDDIAMAALSGELTLPSGATTILVGEGLFNDATALTIFRIAMAATVTHAFSPLATSLRFTLDFCGEIAYGLVLAYGISRVRRWIEDPALGLGLSILTPFLAYLPANQMGGSGVLAVATVGLYTNQVRSSLFDARERLMATTFWDVIAYLVNGFLFVWMGLSLRTEFALASRDANLGLLLRLGFWITAIAISGRFIYVFCSTALLRMLFPRWYRKQPPHSWQFLFIVSWAGIRGAISIAAALLVPAFAIDHFAADSHSLLVTTTYIVVIVTMLFQGTALPFVIRRLRLHEHGRREALDWHRQELDARIHLARVALGWLKMREAELKQTRLYPRVRLLQGDYDHLVQSLHEHLASLKKGCAPLPAPDHDDARLRTEGDLLMRLIEVQREELARLYADRSIPPQVHQRLEEDLDLRETRLTALS